MFAPPMARTKTGGSAAGKVAPALSMLLVRPSRPALREQLPMLHGSIGNQGTFRLLNQRMAQVPGKNPQAHNEHETETRVVGAGVWGDFGHSPVLARQAQNDAPAPAATTAQAEREREVEAINVDGTDYVLYQTRVRGGGSSSWLANNPGNLDYTADTVAWGCYEGKALKWGKHRFAIFPDENTGLAAVRGFLRKNQTTRDITLMMNLFAPATGKNNPTQYSEKVAQRIGGNVTVHTLVKDLSDDQIQIFAEAIKDQEGWTPGPTNDVPRGDPSLPQAVRER
jgi:hypothetical protein